MLLDDCLHALVVLEVKTFLSEDFEILDELVCALRAVLDNKTLC